MSKLSEKLQNLLLTNEQKVQFAILGRIATALEVIVEQQYHIALRPNLKQGKDESEIMESVDEVYAQQEVDDLMKGRPEEED
jgi:hypothetical protein